MPSFAQPDINHERRLQMAIRARPSIRPGPWRDLAENKTIHVIGTALLENSLTWCILWRSEEHEGPVWIKSVEHWSARLDDGRKRFVIVE